MKLLLIILLLLISLNADDTNATSEYSYVDKYHKIISKKVLQSSSYLDNTLSSYLNNDSNTSDNNLTEDEVLENDVSSVDQFFQSDKFLDETEKAFVRVRYDSSFQSKEEEEFNLKFSAQIPLSKSKEKAKSKFNIFISDLTEDNAKEIGQDDTESSENAPELGVNYFAPETYGIIQKYSIGIRGIYPFAKARYSKSINVGDWIIEPTQDFKYSTKNDFEENTKIYFDTTPTDLTLFRFQLTRGTKSRKDGMDYSIGASYFWSPFPKAGVSIAQVFSGNTEYKYVIDEHTDPVKESEKFAGISRYSTSLSWRHNVWKKWFFYELRPGVNFARNYNYEPNYTIRVFIDVFFGNFN